MSDKLGKEKRRGFLGRGGSRDLLPRDRGSNETQEYKKKKAAPYQGGRGEKTARVENAGLKVERARR